MTTSPILGITHVAAAETNKYLRINAATDALEAAMLDSVDVVCTAGGSIAVSAATLQANAILYLTGTPAGAFNLDLGAVARWVLIFNDTGQTATIRAGTPSTTQALTNNTMGLFVVDVNNVYTLASSGGSYTDEAAQDAIGIAIAAGTQSGIIVTYNDSAGAIDFTVPGNSDYQESVRIISTTDLTLSGTYTTQSVALVDGDRVGAFGQTYAPDRRIWVVRAGAWDIAEGWDVADTVTTNAQVTADEGTYEGSTYRLTTTGTITLGTTSLAWELNEAAISQYTNRNVNGAAYTILSSDRNKWIYLGRAGNQAVTLEEYAVQPMANGSQFVVQYYGASGTKTVTADAAVTLNGTTGGVVTLSAQFDAYLFKQKSRNVWVAVPWAGATGGGLTQENVEDYVAAMIQNGTGITWSYNDGTGQLTPTVTITQYTDELAQDAINSLISAGTHDGVSFSYNDAGDALSVTAKPKECLIIAASDETTAITTGTNKVTFRMPYAFTLSAVRASVTTAPTGSTIIIDVNEAGSTILSTKLSIDASEKTSTTAASAAVISDTSLADDAEITIDFDQVGSTIAGAGVKVYLIGNRT